MHALNDPIAYGTDFFCRNKFRSWRASLANFHSVKESSADVRRVSAIRALLGERWPFSSVDDAIFEAFSVGATGWIAGLANALQENRWICLTSSRGKFRRFRALSLVFAAASARHRTESCAAH